VAAPTAPYLSGSKKESLDAAVFGEPFHEALVHEAARAELNARRRGTASTKTRGEVAMTGAKAWRQKGTGRARAGALSTPQRYGGGVAFGPKPRSYTAKVNRKARRKALRAALSVHAARGSVSIVDAAAFDAPSTKQAAGLVKGDEGGHTLVALGREGEDAAAKSFRNIAGVRVLPADAVGVADVIGARRLVLSPAALALLTRIAVGAKDAPAVAAAESGTGEEEAS
jgi:large subunit ribosomal protein L4